MFPKVQFTIKPMFKIIAWRRTGKHIQLVKYGDWLCMRFKMIKKSLLSVSTCLPVSIPIWRNMILFPTETLSFFEPIFISVMHRMIKSPLTKTFRLSILRLSIYMTMMRIFILTFLFILLTSYTKLRRENPHFGSKINQEKHHFVRKLNYLSLRLIIVYLLLNPLSRWLSEQINAAMCSRVCITNRCFPGNSSQRTTSSNTVSDWKVVVLATNWNPC